MTDQHSLKVIGWAFGAATVVVFVIAMLLAGGIVTSANGAAGYGTAAVAAPAR